jgi:enoyl-CoA hydratase
MRTVTCQDEGRLLVVTLNRPHARNAIDREMNAELHEIWRRFAADDAVDVAILTGEGPSAFCAGADLRDYLPQFLGNDARLVRQNAATGLGGITRGLHGITKPIIAAVNGWALAGGFELALACDVRIASDTAQFGSFEIHRGFHHGDGGIVRLLACVGLSRTMDIVLSGRTISAREAEQIGLVSQVVPQALLMQTARTRAADMLAKSQTALRSAKETILAVLGRPLDDALRLEALNGYSSGNPQEIRAALQAFLGAAGSLDVD